VNPPCIIIPSILSSSAPDIAALELDSSRLSRIYALSLTSKGKHTPSQTWLRKLKRDDWMQRLSGRTCSPSHTQNFEDWWISRVRESPVSPIATPDSAKVEPMKDFSLTTGSLDSSKCVRAASSSKTSKDSLPVLCQTELFASDGRWRDWSAWATALRADYSARKNAARHILGSGSGFWPTPTANEDKDQNASFATLARLDRGGRILRRIATLTMRGNGPVDQMNLNDGGNRRERLNPAWVESLLGLPLSWTACDSSETESSPQLPI